MSRVVLRSIAACALLTGALTSCASPSATRDGAASVEQREGCSNDVPALNESDDFTPFAVQRGPSQLQRVDASRSLAESVSSERGRGIAPAALPERLGSRALIGTSGYDDNALVPASVSTMTLYGQQAWAALSGGSGLDGFYSAGGIAVTVSDSDGEDVGAVTVARSRGRSIPVKVGSTTAALTWADPRNAEGLRVRVLQWTQDGSSIRVVADAKPGEIVRMGRGIAC